MRMSLGASYSGIMLRLHRNHGSSTLPASTMTIYVDEITNYPSSKLKYWCHMWSDQGDSPFELHQMADKLGLSRTSFLRNHYVLTETYREQAMRMGCPAVTNKHGIEIRNRLKQKTLP